MIRKQQLDSEGGQKTLWTYKALELYVLKYTTHIYTSQ